MISSLYWNLSVPPCSYMMRRSSSFIRIYRLRWRWWLRASWLVGNWLDLVYIEKWLEQTINELKYRTRVLINLNTNIHVCPYCHVKHTTHIYSARSSQITLLYLPLSAWIQIALQRIRNSKIQSIKDRSTAPWHKGTKINYQLPVFIYVTN